MLFTHQDEWFIILQTINRGTNEESIRWCCPRFFVRLVVFIDFCVTDNDCSCWTNTWVHYTQYHQKSVDTHLWALPQTTATMFKAHDCIGKDRSLDAVALEFRFTTTKRPKPVPVCWCPCSQPEVHKDMVCLGWCGRMSGLHRALTSSSLNTSGINWNTDCVPCLLIDALVTEWAQIPISTFQNKVFPEEWRSL